MMRTTILLLAALVTMHVTCNAQSDTVVSSTTSAPSASFYATFGSGRSDIFALQQDRIADVDRIDHGSSLALRAGVSLPLGSVIALRPEVGYARRGVDLVEIATDGRTHTDQVRFDYVSIALPIQFSAPLSGILRGHVAIGPYGAWMLRSTVDDVSPVDAGVAVEAGLGIHVLGLGVIASVRMDHGMVPLADDDPYLVNRDITLNIGISIP